MLSLYTLIHFVHFLCIICVTPLYNSAIYSTEVMCSRRYVNHISNDLTEKIVDELGQKHFPQTLLLGKVS